MGDRCNIVMKQSKGNVWYYGHWAGHDYTKAVQRALAKNERWDDAPYLSRMVFDQFVGEDRGQSTGFGISLEMEDNEHDICVVDCETQTVRRVKEGGEGKEDGLGATVKEWPFAEFAALPEDALNW